MFDAVKASSTVEDRDDWIPTSAPGIPELANLGVVGGRYRLACSPARASTGGLNATDEPFLVNCEKCLATKAYKDRAPQRRKPELAFGAMGDETRKLVEEGR